MQPSDEEHSTPPDHRSNATARYNAMGSESTSAPSLRQFQTLNSDLDTTRLDLRNASATLLDTLNHLQQIRSSLRFMEPSESTASRNGERSVQRNSTSNLRSRIGPPHTAIVLSEGDNSMPPDPDGLRDRLDALGAELPEYIRAATDIIRNITQGTTNEGHNAVDSSEGLTTSRQPISRVLSSRSTQAGFGRYIQPRRERNPSAVAGAHIRQEIDYDDSQAAHTLPVRRTASRDDDTASTMLGRRVASRAAAAMGRSSGTPHTRQPSRVFSVPIRLRPEHFGPSDAGSVNTSASRVIVPSRSPDRVSRRIAQFESNAHDHRHQADSEGSETEVDDSVYRPIMVRRNVESGNRTRSIRQRRTDNRESLLSLPDLLPVGPSSSGGTQSGPSSADSSPRPVEEERPAGVSSRMHEVYGRRPSNALSVSPGNGRATLALADGEGLDAALFSRPPVGRQERGSAYHEVVDEDEGRSYRIRRRFNADGDEQVHQINADTWWDADVAFELNAPSYSTISSRESSFTSGREDSLLLRHPNALVLQPAATPVATGNAVLDRTRRQHRVPAYTSQGQRSETDLPRLSSDRLPQDTNIASRRRRGWARLNPDGDEIPTDEEEEIERVRTEQRIRYSQSGWRNTLSSSTARTRLEYLAPTTRSVFSHSADEDEDENDVRVRLRVPPGQSVRNATFTVFSDMRREKDEAETKPKFFGTAEPYYHYPLPISLEEMAPSIRRSSLPPSSTKTGLRNLRETELAGR